jgi:protein TonB
MFRAGFVFFLLFPVLSVPRLRSGTGDSILTTGDSILTITVRRKDNTLIEKYYPGGTNRLMIYLFQNITYPAMEIDQEIQGTVVLSFVITPDGKVSDIKVERGIAKGPNLEKTAIQALKNMQGWDQAIRNGMPPNVRQSISVNFFLNY